MKKAIILIIIAGLIAGLYGYYQFNREAENLGSKDADLTDVAGFISEYQKDEIAADAKYLDKVVEVKGKVAEVKKDESGAVKLSFISDDPMSTVIAEMDPAVAAEALKLAPNAEVTIKGVCTGSLGDIVCVRSVIK